MNIFRRHSLVALLIVGLQPFASSASDLPQLPEDVFPQLKSVLQESLRQSPRMLLRQLDLEIASGELLQARSGLYPSVGGYYQRTESKDEREDFPGQSIDTSKTYYNLSLNQPLFHWGERVNNAKIGAIRSSIVEKQYTEAYRLLAQEIRKAYMDLISYKSQLANVRYSRKLADEELRAGEERVASKLVAEGELFRLRIAAEQAALSEETLESQLISTKELYASLTGKTAPADEQIPDEVPPPSYYQPTYDNLLASFLGQNEPDTPALEIMRQQIEVDTLTYKNQRKRLLPKVSLLVGVSQDEQSYTINNAQKYGVLSQYVGLYVNWAIFDGFATRGAVRSALARKSQNTQNYQIALESQQRQAQSYTRVISLAYRQMAISDRLLDNSLQYLKYRQEDFKRGQASEADVSQAQANYNSALVSANNSRINFLMKGAEFVSLVARDPVVEAVDFN
jgi:outer membrane protein TolC